MVFIVGLNHQQRFKSRLLLSPFSSYFPYLFTPNIANFFVAAIRVPRKKPEGRPRKHAKWTFSAIIYSSSRAASLLQRQCTRLFLKPPLHCLGIVFHQSSSASTSSIACIISYNFCISCFYIFRHLFTHYFYCIHHSILRDKYAKSKLVNEVY
ncbi:MAG: hypothetical protein JWQ40_3665 [Segetibacter sp.]|nr:hypothetical protein [Segetibacter sp.]